MKTDTSLKAKLKAKIAAQTWLMALLVGLCCGLPQQASAIGSGDADTMFNEFNSAFLVNGSYYKTTINGSTFSINGGQKAAPTKGLT